MKELVNIHPATYDEIDLDKHTKLVFEPRLVLDIYREDRFLCVSDEGLNIDVFVDDISELCQEIEDQIRMHWKEYAKTGDHKLSPDAIDLKRRLLSRIKEVKK